MTPQEAKRRHEERQARKWVTLEDGAGRTVTVRRVDAREIEEGKARRAGEVVVEAPKEVEPLVEVDDQSVAPKAVKAAKKSK